jgi:hypothetical protein
MTAPKKWPRLFQYWAFRHRPAADTPHGPGQFIVDQRQELVGRLLVAFRDGVQDLGDLAHEG